VLRWRRVVAMAGFMESAAFSPQFQIPCTGFQLKAGG